MVKKKDLLPNFPEKIHPALKEAFGYRLMHAAMKYRKSLLVILDEYGMIPPQMAVLKILDDEAEINQATLASELSLDKVTMVRTLDGLEERGFIKRSVGKADKRQKMIHITREGKEVIASIKKRNQAREKNFLSPLTATEAETLKKLIMKL